MVVRAQGHCSCCIRLQEVESRGCSDSALVLRFYQAHGVALPPAKVSLLSSVNSMYIIPHENAQRFVS